MFANGRIWLAYLIVFLSSTCTMVIELIAGRILAPFIGVSLYTWTSIIGVVLAGISLGNYLGGLIADQRASRQTLGVVYIAGGLASAGILVMTNIIFTTRLELDLLLKIVVITTVIFFLPAVILGMVSPIVIKLALANSQGSGKTVGSIYAFSTVGSIVGTFLTGFWLISWLGTRTIVWGVAGILILLGIIIGEFWHPKARTAVLLVSLLVLGAAVWGQTSGSFRFLPNEIYTNLPKFTSFFILGLPVLFVLGIVFLPGLRQGMVGVASTALAFIGISLVYVGWTTGAYNAPCEVESNYFCIRTVDQVVDGHPVRSLVLDHLIHSYVSLDDPKVLGYGYEQVYDEITKTYLASQAEKTPANPALDTLFIGGGGYTFPKYLEAIYSYSSVDVLEIDPAVTEMAYEKLNLPRDTRIRSFNSDARTFLITWDEPKLYDVVYGDAFNDLSVPYHLTTVEFNRIIASRMKPDGIYVINVIDKYRDGEFMKAFANSLGEVFPHVYLLSQGEAWKGNNSNTYVLLASRQPYSINKLEQVIGIGASTKMLSEEEFLSYRNSGRKIVLTDDFVPVDQLVAPLFVDRGF